MLNLNSTRSAEDMVTVTCGLKPLPWFDVGILGYLMLRFQVGLTEHDCNQISQKESSCSADKLSHITLKSHQSRALISGLYVLHQATMVLFGVSNSSHGNHTADNPTHQGAHVLPSTLIISLLLIIVVLLTIYCLRFKNHRKALVTSVDKKIPNGFLEEQGEQTVVLLPRSPSPSKRYFPIPLDSLEEEYRIRSADDGKLFREEFNSLPCYYHHGSFEEASREHNREKNRYPNILPYDHSRVVLSQLDGHLCSDYINASFIDGYKEKNKFIAAQGPKPETVADFWRMIWEQKTTTIVMLTNLKERKEEKCCQYWPEKGWWLYGNIHVATEDVIVLVDYTIRKFCVQYQGSDGVRVPRLVTQLHFTSWPDFGVPFTPIGMLKFLKKVKAVNPSYAGPIVVHCR
ncbi:hypothetical protein XENORESO_007415 [Xenotaenia resolanae]|uniref:protein-tyrosine-phosphatase n=1 Tax=Xenotaenia resolanae TaxID=208358 RepID=A0ABV0VVG0_9TELE